MCVKIFMFVCLGFEDIRHMISFFKTKQCRHLNVCIVHFVEFYFICSRNAQYVLIM